MNDRQTHALKLRNTDIEGALYRIGGNEAVYTACLRSFTEDPTVSQLNAAIRADSYDEAFTAAHALKGMAGNMGFMPLMHAAARMVVLIRGGRIMELDESLEQVNSAYRDISDGIKQFFRFSTQASEGEQK